MLCILSLSLFLCFKLNVSASASEGHEISFVNDNQNAKRVNFSNDNLTMNTNLNQNDVFSSFFMVQSRAYSTQYVYTPRGTAVEVLVRDELSLFNIEKNNR